MKRIFYIGLAASFLAVSCQKEMEPAAKPAEGKVYTAVIEGEQTRSSVTVDGKTAKFSWENGDPITVISSDGTAEENTVINVAGGNATFSLSKISSPKYATYPQIAKTYTGGNLSEVALPAVYDNYTGSTNVAMFADMSGGNDVANFRHIGGAVRITLKNIPADCDRFRFIANGKKITGNFAFDPTADVPAICTSDAETGNTVTFNFTEGTKNMDFYIPVPVGTYEGFTVKLYNGDIIRYRKSSERTFSVDRKGLHGFKALELPLVLHFDFNVGVDLPGWPTAKYSHTAGVNKKCTYTLDGVKREFILADPPEGTSGEIFLTAASDGCRYLKFNAVERYLGLPAIEGKRLVRVKCTNEAAANGGNKRDAGITAKVWNDFPDTAAARKGIVPVPGGEVKKLTSKHSADASDMRSGRYSWNLRETENNTVYYLYNPTSWIGIRDMELTYEGEEKLISEIETAPDDDGTITVRVGSFNIRVSGMDDDKGTDNEWSKRKTRVIKSIRDKDFDFFGVQEVTTEQQTYLTEQLSDTYTCKFFSPYASNGNGDKAQGLIYKKDKYTLSDWKYFWPSDTPDKMPSLGNDIVSLTQRYKRGSCCGILTHNESGVRMFIMVMHGFLNNDTGDTYAYVNNDREGMYNPDGYPAFFVGDMNTDPGRAAYTTWTGHWKDSFAELSEAKKTGPTGTYNGWKTTTTPSKRIDYIFFKGDAVPKNYVCDDDKYDNLYPSDHCPIYTDFKITIK